MHLARTVNSGPPTAIKLLRRALNRLGAKLNVDGVIGLETRAAAAAHPTDDVNRALVDIRLAFYDDIVAGDPRQQAFIKGLAGTGAGIPASLMLSNQIPPGPSAKSINSPRG